MLLPNHSSRWLVKSGRIVLAETKTLPPYHNSDANAHLIAAAPELLAALQLITAHAHEPVPEDILVVVSDVIAKALGRS